MIKVRLDDKGLFLKLEIDKETPGMLHGDEIRIKQIITNILTNAAKYTEKGSVTFSVAYSKIEDDPGAILLMVSVKDTGIGIKQEDIQKMKDFDIPEEERELFDQLGKVVKNYDYDGILELLQNQAFGNVMSGERPAKRIYEAVKKIPCGHVATYSQIAEVAGDRKMARAVGNALHRNPDPDNIPCFRVVSAKGKLSEKFAFGGAEAQAKLLEAEGIEVVDGKVDLSKYQWML